VSRQRRSRNNVRTLREELLLSKAELARRAEVSPLTINRVESGEKCRLDTKRKIILALGKQLAEKESVFPGLAKDHDDTGNSETTETVSRQSTPHEDE
jgi:DNA-binding XRE family transcriptional regulator